MDLLRFVLLGLGAGAAYAMAAQGIVLVYRGSGVLNFAHGATGMLAAFTFYELRDTLGIATSIALPAALLVGAILGLVIYVLVMRPLRKASALARLMATLALLTLFLALGYALWGYNYRSPSPVLPASVVEPLPGTPLGLDRVLLVAIAILLTVVLSAVWSRTRFGLATSAVAENELAAATLGHSVHLIAVVNWIVGSVLASLAAIVIAPIIGLQPAELTLLVLPALAAALVGRFESFYWTLLGGLAIGSAESVLVRFVGEPGVAKAAPFLAIVLVLFLRGQNLPIRGEAAARPPEIGTGQVRLLPLAATTIGAAVALQWLLPIDWVVAATASLVTTVIIMSVVVVTGYAGQVSLAQFALAGVGAWAASRLIVTASFPFELALIAGVGVTAILGTMVGIPALRTRGANLAIVTLGLALALERLILLNPDRTGGAAGTNIGSARLFGADVGAILHPRRYALVVLAITGLTALIVSNLRRSRTGRRLVAVRSNERSAAALGISVFRAKLTAFAIASGIAGLGGVLLAYRSPAVVFRQFELVQSIYVVMWAVIGGVGYVIGAVLGGLLALGGIGEHLGRELFSDAAQDWVRVGAGVLVVAILLHDANGLASLHISQWNWLKAKARRIYTKPRRIQNWVPSPSGPSSEGDLNTSPRGEDHSAATSTPQSSVNRASTRVKDPDSHRHLGLRSGRRLAVADAAVHFGGVRAVDGISFTVEPGEVLGLIGPNGAGKTTVVDAISGNVHLTAGSILLDGKDLAGKSPSRRAHEGIQRSFQSLELFDTISVMDNLRIASEAQEGWTVTRDLLRPAAEPLSSLAAAAIHEFGLSEVLHQRPEDLPFGRRRLVALARAVAANPAVLLLDEPVAGLSQSEREWLKAFVDRVAHEYDLAVLLIEHDVDFVLSVSDRIVAMDFGKKIADGAPTDVASDPEVISAYLGGDDAREDVVPTAADTPE